MRPVKIDNANDPNFVYAICRCCVPTNYAIKIPRTTAIEYPFECEDCGTKGVVVTRASMEDLNETIES